MQKNVDLGTLPQTQGSAQTKTRAEQANEGNSNAPRQDPARVSDSHGLTDRSVMPAKSRMNLDQHDSQMRHDQDQSATPLGKTGPTKVTQRRADQKPNADGHVLDEHRLPRPEPMNTPAKAATDPRKQTHRRRVADEGKVHTSGAFAKTNPHPADEHRTPKMSGGVEDPRTASASGVLAKPDRIYEDEGRTRHPKDGFGTALDVQGPSAQKAQPGQSAQQATLSTTPGFVGQPTTVGGPVPVTARPDSVGRPDRPDSVSRPADLPDSSDRAERDSPRESEPVEHVAAHDDVGGGKPIRGE